MRITSIELAGEARRTTRDGEGLPGAFARISRKTGAEHIEVTVLTPGGEHTHQVDPGSHDDLWSMAECLQETLDGCVGTNSMIHDYYRELERFAD